jgi:hypothetical protein
MPGCGFSHFWRALRDLKEVWGKAVEIPEEASRAATMRLSPASDGIDTKNRRNLPKVYIHPAVIPRTDSESLAHGGTCSRQSQQHFPFYSVGAIVSLPSGVRVLTNIKISRFGHGRMRVRHVALGTFHQQSFPALFDQAWQGLAAKHEHRRNYRNSIGNPSWTNRFLRFNPAIRGMPQLRR